MLHVAPVEQVFYRQTHVEVLGKRVTGPEIDHRVTGTGQFVIEGCDIVLRRGPGKFQGAAPSLPMLLEADGAVQWRDAIKVIAIIAIDPAHVTDLSAQSQ